MSYISQYFIDQISAGVSATKAQSVSAFHTNIRSLLSGYDTFLQGSYANDTAVSDIDDVDIVALEPPSQEYLPTLNAATLFQDVKTKIETNVNYRGNVTIHRKCLTLTLQNLKADIVPAVKPVFTQSNTHGEPIAIAHGIVNYPKTHLQTGRNKNIRTNNNYKKIVRMLKNFARNRNLQAEAPSYYLESLVHSYGDNSFHNDLPRALYDILLHATGQNFNYNFTTVAGDKPVISNTEWNIVNFLLFQGAVSAALPDLYNALIAQNEANANFYFRKFFQI